jgi:hypothetical protein
MSLMLGFPNRREFVATRRKNGKSSIPIRSNPRSNATISAARPQFGLPGQQEKDFLTVQFLANLPRLCKRIE